MLHTYILGFHCFLSSSSSSRSPFLLFSLLFLLLISFVFLPPPPPPHFYCFSLLLPLISIVFPPPPHFYCFLSSSSFLLFSLLLLISTVFPLPLPPPPPHVYCFPSSSSSSSSSSFLLFSSSSFLLFFPPPHFYCFPCSSSFLLFFLLIISIVFSSSSFLLFPSSSSFLLLFPPPPPHSIVFYPSPTRFIFFSPRDSIKDCQLPSLVHFEVMSLVVNNNRGFLQLLADCPGYQRQFLLKTDTQQQLHALVQVLYNLLMGHFLPPKKIISSCAICFAFKLLTYLHWYDTMCDISYCKVSSLVNVFMITKCRGENWPRKILISKRIMRCEIT